LVAHEATFTEVVSVLGEKLLLELRDYVERRWDDNLSLSESIIVEEPAVDHSKPLAYSPHISEVEEYVEKTRQPSFQQVLFDYIDAKNASDADIYKKAGVDRRHFSKIRSKSGYRPGRNTVIALAIALELDKKETDKLLGSAGYSLSESETFDLVIQFCLEKKIYNMDDVNQALDYFSLKPLFGMLE